MCIGERNSILNYSAMPQQISCTGDVLITSNKFKDVDAIREK